MSLLAQVKTTAVPTGPLGYAPVKLNIQGGDGVGKSTFASQADDVIFIQAEDGLKYIDAPRFPVAETWQDLINQLLSLAKEDHQYKTICLDTTDAASILAERHVCEKNNWESIETPGYGKGYTAVRELWVHLLDGFQACYRVKNMNIIFLSHVAVKPFNDAIHEPYDRWEMRCHKSVNALIKDWVDFNFFANFEVNVQKDGSKNRAISYGNRALFTKFAAGYDAKSRVELPNKLNFEWSAFLEAYKAAIAPQQPPKTAKKGAK
tara:strand:+ start:14 stop:802 length:789 start_codon:yes stop_codon:yes gene_type:complete